MTGILVALVAITAAAIVAVAVPRSRVWIAGIGTGLLALGAGILALTGRKPRKPSDYTQRRLEEHDHGHQESVRRRVRDAEEEHQRRQEIADIPDEVERLEAELADWKS